MEKTIIDILLDADNREPIWLSDESGHHILFEQVAVIPRGKKLYCVLKPLTLIKGIGEDEALIFYVKETPGEPPYLKIETDEIKALDVFEEYYSMLKKHKKK